MRPYPEEVLRAIQSGIMAHFAPELTSSYSQAQLAFAMMLFAVLQRDYDSAVPDLVETNRALRALLKEASVALELVRHEESATTQARLAALPEPAASLHLSALRAENETLRRALAKLAPLVEPAADDPALAPLIDVRARIISWLAADAKKRIVPILSA